MSLLDDVSIVVTPNGYKAGELYAVVPVPTEGAELITNGDFATDTDWVKGTGWTISGGSATSDGSGTSFLYQIISNVQTKRFLIEYEVKDYVSGSVSIILGSAGSDQLTSSSNGVVSGIVLWDGTSDRLNFKSVSLIGSIDNVSIKEYTSADMDVTRATAATRVDEDGLVNYAEILGGEEITNGDFATDSDWTKGTGWTISGGKGVATSVGSGQRLQQDFSFTNGKSYKIVVVLSSYTSGRLGIYMGGAYMDTSIVEGGTYTYSHTPTSGSEFFFRVMSSGTTLSIDNISVKEVTRDNVPRIDYTGGGCPHILVEPQRTNTVTYSEDFSQWTIDGNASITSNATTSPDGTENATKLIAGSSSGRQAIKLNNTSSGDLAVSVFAKKGEYSVIQLSDARNATAFINFDLLNGSVGSSSVMTGEIVSLGNDWYKCIATYNSASNIISMRLSIAESSTSARLVNFSGNGTDGLYIWGAQVEVGSYATSYIPTSGSTVTRNQDIFTRDGIGSLINSTEGVLFVELENITGTDATNKMISITDGSLTNKISLFVSSNQISVESAGSGTNLGIYSKALQSGFNKIAVKYKVNDCALWVNGTEYTDTSFAAFSSSTLNALVFDRGDGTQNLFGKVKQLQVYNTALTDAQLTSLTT